MSNGQVDIVVMGDTCNDSGVMNNLLPVRAIELIFRRLMDILLPARIMHCRFVCVKFWYVKFGFHIFLTNPMSGVWLSMAE